jgi:C-terminal processing protease CtpA/Prc
MVTKDTNVNRIVGPERVLSLYTAANCDRRAAQIGQLRRLLAADPAEAEALGWLDENLALVRSMRGRGLVEETVEPEDVPVHAAPEGQIVALLTDVTTSDAAERLALMAKKARRVVQVGRATRGSLDYSNPVAIAFDNRFVFTYPMTKTVAAAEGHGMRGRGVEPDVAIPFTPEECVRDVLMERTFAEAFGL